MLPFWIFDFGFWIETAQPSESGCGWRRANLCGVARNGRRRADALRQPYPLAGEGKLSNLGLSVTGFWFSNPEAQIPSPGTRFPNPEFHPALDEEVA
jgi:hypothetical protein